MENRGIRRKNGRETALLTIARLSAGGFAAGVVNGIFGNGGGILAVFLLGSVGSKLFEDKRGIFANVTAAILPMAIASALVYSSFSPPDMYDAVAVAAASLAGGGVGAFLLGRLDPDSLKRIFAVIMTVSGCIMLFAR